MVRLNASEKGEVDMIGEAVAQAIKEELGKYWLSYNVSLFIPFMYELSEKDSNVRKVRE